MKDSSDGSLSSRTLGVALPAAGASLLGAYWDDAWHTGRGRDSFFIAPHLAIYIGVSLVGSIVALRVARVVRAQGLASVRASGPLTLALLAVTATLISAPIDNAWHISFGRDAVLWSPPHMLGIAGTLSLAAALAAGARHASRLRGAAGGLVLAAATFPVAEYETDVPQFSSDWYLPVLALGASVGFALVAAAAPEDPWARTRAAVFHLGFFALVVVFLSLESFPIPAVPVLLAAALAADLVARRGVSPGGQAVVLAVALTSLTAVLRSVDGSEIVLGASALLIAAVAAPLSALAVRFAAGARRAPLPVVAAIAALLVAGGLPAPRAEAHDPGQGDDAGLARVVLRAEGLQLGLRGNLASPCHELRTGRLVARRAGRTLTTPLRVSGCAFAGEVVVPERGRWFVYAELAGRAGPRELWLPVTAGDRDAVFDASRFVYVPGRRSPSAVKLGAGAVLYAAMALLLAAALRLARPSPWAPQPA